MIMYNDYICHGDHKYLARVKTAANKYRYFYTQAAYNAFKNAKAIGTGLLAASNSAYNRKKLGTTNRRTDVFAQWDEARRKEYETNVVNATGPGAGQHALNNWNQMISDFGNAIWKRKGELLVQPTVSTEAAYDNYYGRPKSSYRIRPKSREKNVTGEANANSMNKREGENISPASPSPATKNVLETVKKKINAMPSPSKIAKNVKMVASTAPKLAKAVHDTKKLVKTGGETALIKKNLQTRANRAGLNMDEGYHFAGHPGDNQLYKSAKDMDGNKYLINAKTRKIYSYDGSSENAKKVMTEADKGNGKDMSPELIKKQRQIESGGFVGINVNPINVVPIVGNKRKRK